MVVDGHAHVWRAAPAQAALPPTIVSGTSDVPIDLLRAYLDEHAVDRAVLVQPLYPGQDNSYVAGCAAADPARFAAVCVVDPGEPAASARLAEWVSRHGCRGLRLRPRLPAEAATFGRPASYPLWEAARDLGVVVSVLAGPEHLPALAALAERFPEVAIVVDHLAHPDLAGGPAAGGFQDLLALARYPRVFVKLSGYYYFSRGPYPYADCHALVQSVCERFGPARMLWGSDFPHVLLRLGYRRGLRLPQRVFSFLSPADLDLVMGRNALALYWPGAAAPGGRHAA